MNIILAENKLKIKKAFIIDKYEELIKKIENLIKPENIELEINSNLFGLWHIYNYLDTELVEWNNTLKNKPSRIRERPTNENTNGYETPSILPTTPEENIFENIFDSE